LIAELDIKNKESLIKRKSLYAEQQGQLAQQEEHITSLEEQNKTLERQIVQAGITSKVKDAEVSMKKSDIQRAYEDKLNREKEINASNNIINNLETNLGGNNGSSE